MTDQDFVDIICQLDGMAREVNDWEASFISSCLGLSVFTDAQKQVIVDMAKRYLDE